MEAFEEAKGSFRAAGLLAPSSGLPSLPPAAARSPVEDDVKRFKGAKGERAQPTPGTPRPLQGAAVDASTPTKVTNVRVRKTSGGILRARCRCRRFRSRSRRCLFRCRVCGRSCCVVVFLRVACSVPLHAECVVSAAAAAAAAGAVSAAAAGSAVVSLGVAVVVFGVAVVVARSRHGFGAPSWCLFSSVARSVFCECCRCRCRCCCRSFFRSRCRRGRFRRGACWSQSSWLRRSLLVSVLFGCMQSVL